MLIQNKIFVYFYAIFLRINILIIVHYTNNENILNPENTYIISGTIQDRCGTSCQMRKKLRMLIMKKNKIIRLAEELR